MDFRTFQAETDAWGAKNFPKSGAVEQLLGIVEEYGEILSAISDRNAVWSNREATDKATAEIRDGIGDMIVFTTNYCNKNGWDMNRILRASGHPVESFEDLEQSVWSINEFDSPYRAANNLGIAVGKLAHHRLKRWQGIRGSVDHHEAEERKAIGQILTGLACLTLALGERLDPIVTKTWDEVKARDWTKNSLTGVTANAS